jgi:CRP-like cAMP-binding protein
MTAVGLVTAAREAPMPVASHEEKRKLFERHFLLGRLSGSEIDALLTYARVQRYRAGQEIFAKGSPGDSMMAVLRGHVKISSPSPDGKEIVLNIINEGEIFGEIALLDGKERTADAVAMTDCELLVLSRRDFLPFLERHVEICIALLGVLCERLRRTSEQVEDVLFRHLESRLAKALLWLARDGGHDAARVMELKLSQREIGNIVGGTRESINKHLQAWRKSGIIAVDKGSIRIKDVDALERLA